MTPNTIPSLVRAKDRVYSTVRNDVTMEGSADKYDHPTGQRMVMLSRT